MPNSPNVHIVCKYCGHGKHWHNLTRNLCHAPDGEYYECDCPTWEYGVNRLNLPLPPDSELEANEYEDQRTND